MARFYVAHIKNKLYKHALIYTSRLSQLSAAEIREGEPLKYLNTKFHANPCSVSRLVPLGQTFTYLLTPWSRVLLEKLTGFAANQEVPRI